MSFAADPHARALMLRGRCPECAEHLPAPALFRGAPCPACGALTDGPVDGGPALVAAVRARIRRQRWILAGVLAGLMLLLGWTPFTGAVLLLIAYGWLRVVVLAPLGAMLSPRRRLVTRLTSRLVLLACLLVALLLAELLTVVVGFAVPFKMVLVAGQVLLGTAFLTGYAGWQLEREGRGRPVAAWEWVPIASSLLILAGSAAGCAWLLFTATAWLHGHLPWLVR